MKAVFGGIVVAAILAVSAAMVLDTNFQRTADLAYRTEGVRL